MSVLIFGLLIFFILFTMFLFVYMCWTLCPIFDGFVDRIFDKILKIKMSKDFDESCDDEW